ncbi:hypothetical protein RHMOL_Rhmol07G0197400 [Rhododendron molle]|uniref:Uncharacterized protein n=1 Tax=Rhododendron molle TaxID=49168 RepID=A0ACC0N413_RHOML|nr:hypothetical protein RHMOL_Rhmol07G0197400 [Rhododendron molle]
MAAANWDVVPKTLREFLCPNQIFTPPCIATHDANVFKSHMTISNSLALKNQIQTFSERENKSFYACWGRYKDLLIAVPNHGFENFQIANYFYDALSQKSHAFIDVLCDGKLFDKEPTQALDFFDRLAATLQSRVFVKHFQGSNSNAMEEGIEPHRFIENVILDYDSSLESTWSDEPIDESEVPSSPLMDPPLCDDTGEKCLTAKVVSSDLPYLDPSPEELLLAHEMKMFDISGVYYEDPLAKSLTAKEMDAEVDYLYSLLAKQDAYEPIEELEAMKATIVPSNFPCLDLLPAKEMDGEVDSFHSLLEKQDACGPNIEKLPILELIDFLGVENVNLVYNPLIVEFLNNLKIDFAWAMHLVELKCLKRIRQMRYSKYLFLWHGRIQFLTKILKWSDVLMVIAFNGTINVRNPRLAEDV